VLERTDNDADVDDYIAESSQNRIVGTTEQVVERLKSYAEAGVERVMLQHLNHKDLDMVRLIGSDIREAL
jgi:alkanesulfonate monooxygenase SsuD/methylene tetrahydromethanopterin reductase-like flavin-dependent oxidoreductase (luciferase family)